LVEFDLAVPAGFFCQFSAVVLPVGVTVYRFIMNAVAPIPGKTIRRQVTATTNLGTGVARLIIDDEACNIPLNIPEFPPFVMFGSCNIFPVRWFENANDVPH